jgi:hypothetical protein
MGHDFQRLRKHRLDLVLEELAHRAPAHRESSHEFRLALAQRAAGLLRQHHDVVVLKQHLALAVLEHIEPAEARNTQDAVVFGRRTEQIELWIAVFGDADLPAADIAVRHGHAGVGQLGQFSGLPPLRRLLHARKLHDVHFFT